MACRTMRRSLDLRGWEDRDPTASILEGERESWFVPIPKFNAELILAGRGDDVDAVRAMRNAITA